VEPFNDAEIVDDAPSCREEEVLYKIKNINQSIRENFIEYAELLYEAHKNKYYEVYGYSRFAHFVVNETSLKLRKAWFLVQIADSIKYLGIEWEDVSEIGWRKLGTIAPMLDENNYQYWVNQAKESNLIDLSEEVKHAKNEQRPEKERIETLVFYFDPEQHSIVKEAMEEAKEQYQVRTNKQAITNICYDWYTLG